MSSSQYIERSDVFGFVHPGIDAHTLGIDSVSQLLAECGWQSVVADVNVCNALNAPHDSTQFAHFANWLHCNQITRLGFSYRLNAIRASTCFGRFMHALKVRRLLAPLGGRLRSIYCAGRPAACQRGAQQHREHVTVFLGDESPGETLAKLGIPRTRWPAALTENSLYDEQRLQFARD